MSDSLVTIRFDFAPNSKLDGVAVALASFIQAFRAYSSDKDAVLQLQSIQEGSLVCNLLASAVAVVSIQMLQSDLTSLNAGFPNVLMPTKARPHLKRLLQSVKSFDLLCSGESVSVSGDRSQSLDFSATDAIFRHTTQTGILEKVDLMADSFRIRLPIGETLTCSSATAHLADLSRALQLPVPRVRVSGSGKFVHSGLLPTSIRASKVEVVDARPRLLSLIGDIREEFGSGVGIYEASMRERHADDADLAVTAL